MTFTVLDWASRLIHVPNATWIEAYPTLVATSRLSNNALTFLAQKGLARLALWCLERKIRMMIYFRPYIIQAVGHRESEDLLPTVNIVSPYIAVLY